jgi:hypothetical protein
VSTPASEVAGQEPDPGPAQDDFNAIGAWLAEPAAWSGKLQEAEQARRAKAISSPCDFRDYLLATYHSLDILPSTAEAEDPDKAMVDNHRRVIADLWDMARQLEGSQNPPPPLPAVDSEPAAMSAIDTLLAWTNALIGDARAKRLQFDPQSQTVVLEGMQYPVKNPKAFFLYKTIAEKGGEPITRADLRQQHKGLKGDKTIPNLLDELPPELRETVQRGSNGYWVRLQPPK